MRNGRALHAVWEHGERAVAVEPAMAVLWDRNARLEQELRQTIAEL